MKPVCLVMGAGAGIGGNTAIRFAREGYHAVLCRRGNTESMDRLVAAIEGEGGTATGRLINAADEGVLEDLVAQVEADVGPIEVLLYNLGAQIGDRSAEETSLKQFELGWRLGTFGLFRLAKALCPKMVERGQGTIIVTSATAAVRGNQGQHSHASAMAGRRMLCQTLNAQYAPQGIHVSHVLIDGAVDAPDTLGKMMGEQQFAQLRATLGESDGLMRPDQIAETYWQLHRQHRSAWTFELDLRAYSDLPWWNRKALNVSL